MTWQSVGVMSPGEMGAAVATVLRTHGLRVVTCLEGRSARTRQRAETAQLEVVSTLDRLVSTVEAVLSIVPTVEAPLVGAGIAQAMRQSGASITFIEANAISPMTSTAIEQTITQAGGRYLLPVVCGNRPMRCLQPLLGQRQQAKRTPPAPHETTRYLPGRPKSDR
ncbi:MAG: NAD(P)-binding domain-containing protein [Candidatus Tectomicrobia bacterium]